MNVSKRLVLHFPRFLVDQPIMCRLAREYNIDFNILKASVTPNEEGLLVVELSGVETDFTHGMAYLTGTGVKLQPLSQDVIRNEQKCIQCGGCVALCPSGALYVDSASRAINFDNSKCIACGICVLACPPRAMRISF